MGRMFFDSSFNQNINTWNVSNVEDMVMMFRNTPFNQPLDNWNVANVSNMTRMFQNSAFNQDISNWCVIQINSEPDGFSAFGSLNEAYKPNWGSCGATSNRINTNLTNKKDLNSNNSIQKPILYPNPVRDNINLKLPTSNGNGKQNIKIFDAAGNMVYNMDVEIDHFNSVVQLNANEIIKSTGLYLLRYENEEGDQETIKFYKS
jgi:hypothetical protein